MSWVLEHGQTQWSSSLKAPASTTSTPSDSKRAHSSSVSKYVRWASSTIRLMERLIGILEKDSCTMPSTEWPGGLLRSRWFITLRNLLCPTKIPSISVNVSSQWLHLLLGCKAKTLMEWLKGICWRSSIYNRPHLWPWVELDCLLPLPPFFLLLYVYILVLISFLHSVFAFQHLTCILHSHFISFVQ